MVDENSKMTGGQEDVAATGAQGAKSVELGDELLSEASGGTYNQFDDWSCTSKGTVGYIWLECQACGWKSEEVPYASAAEEVTHVGLLELGHDAIGCPGHRSQIRAFTRFC